MVGCLFTKIIFFRCPTHKDTLFMLLQTSYVKTVWTDDDVIIIIITIRILAK